MVDALTKLCAHLGSNSPPCLLFVNGEKQRGGCSLYALRRAFRDRFLVGALIVSCSPWSWDAVGSAQVPASQLCGHSWLI